MKQGALDLLIRETKEKSSFGAIETLSAGDFVQIPLFQQKGESAIPIVKVGQRVLKGEKIARADQGISCPVHASVSGTVVSIECDRSGKPRFIVVENDYKEEVSPEAAPFGQSLFRAEPEELIKFIQEKGIVGQGGAGFPTWYKLLAAVGRTDVLIVNGLESEPYLTITSRLLRDFPREVVGGALILYAAAGVKKIVFAFSSFQHKEMAGIQKEIGSKSFAECVKVKGKYPAGEEKCLIRSVLKKEVPAGKTPIQIGALVFNAQTCYAVYRAFVSGMPLVERLLSVSGDCIRTPSHLRAPIGVSFGQVIDRCGGFSVPSDVILSGGPMTGQVQSEKDAPVGKNTLAVLALSKGYMAPGECIRCGRCVSACPMRLMPFSLLKTAEKKDWKEAKRQGILSCIRCGSCSYVCPSKIPLSGHISLFKDFVKNQEKERKGEV